MNKKLFLRLNMSYINGWVCHLVSLIYNSFIRLMNHVLHVFIFIDKIFIVYLDNILAYNEA